MRIVQFLFFTISLFMGGLSFAQGNTMLAMQGIIPDLPKEFTIRGEVIIIMDDREGNPMLVSYRRCPDTGKAEVTWWRPGDTRARRIDCSENVSEEDLRGHASWIVPVPRK